MTAPALRCVALSALMAAACGRDDSCASPEAVGTVEWVAELDAFTSLIVVGAGGSAGGVEGWAGSARALRLGPDGEVVWRRDVGDADLSGVHGTLDADGDFFLFQGRASVSRLLALAAADGETVWARDIDLGGGGYAGAELVIGPDDAVWLLLYGLVGPTDLGGGPIDGSAIVARFTADGELLSSGPLDSPPVGDEQLVVAVTGDRVLAATTGPAGTRVVEYGADGVVVASSWLEVPWVASLVRHSSGETTLVAHLSLLMHYDDQFELLWQDEVPTGGAASHLAGLSDGGVMIDQPGRSFVFRYAAGGDRLGCDEIEDVGDGAAYIQPRPQPPGDRYWVSGYGIDGDVTIGSGTHAVHGGDFIAQVRVPAAESFSAQ